MRNSEFGQVYMNGKNIWISWRKLNAKTAKDTEDRKGLTEFHLLLNSLGDSTAKRDLCVLNYAKVVSDIRKSKSGVS